MILVNIFFASADTIFEFPSVIFCIFNISFELFKIINFNTSIFRFFISSVSMLARSRGD